jgi:hypothetical protein
MFSVGSISPWYGKARVYYQMRLAVGRMGRRTDGWHFCLYSSLLRMGIVELASRAGWGTLDDLVWDGLGSVFPLCLPV